MRWICLLAGGMLGTALRYLLSTWTNTSVKGPFAPGTLAVNVIGCLLIGFISVFAAEKLQTSESFRLFLMVGFLGSFTTFSTFTYETHALAASNQSFWAVFNVLASVGLGLSAFVFGNRFAVWLGVK